MKTFVQVFTLVTTNYYTIINTTSINEISDKGIYVYPNPTTDNIYFEFDNLNSATSIEIFDIHGVKLIDRLMNNNKEISINHLSQGMYFYQINNGKKVYKGKIMKK